MEPQKNIVIFGHTGMVGSKIFRYYTEKNFNVAGRSLDNETPDFNGDLKKADYIFISVPTPYDWQTELYDLSMVEDVLAYLEEHELKEDAKVILKSTVPPETTAAYQKVYNLNLLFNPEFLSESTAWEDFVNPDRQIVGYTDKSKKYAIEVLHVLPISPYDVIMTSTEAELVKYINNFHGALMVIFANLMFDMCKKTGQNYEAVKEASKASKWVGSPMGRMYWEVEHKGFRGYGGKCFPKDVNTLIRWSAENEIDCEILMATRMANKRLLAKQGLTEQEVEKISERVVTK